MTALDGCPGCGLAMGDGDRVTYGRCALCRHRRRRPTLTVPPPRQALTDQGAHR